MKLQILFIVWAFNFLNFVHASDSLAPVPRAENTESVYKKNDYYVACCPEKCCPSCCYCGCESCDNRPYCIWDDVKHRLAFCIYVVTEQSRRENEKRGCSMSCNRQHHCCVNNGVSARNCIGQCYDASRKCKCPGSGNASACDFCGCCIRKIELSTEPVAFSIEPRAPQLMN